MKFLKCPSDNEPILLYDKAFFPEEQIEINNNE